MRWTGAEDANPSLQHILFRLKDKTGVDLSIDSLITIESRQLATSHFTMLAQAQNGLPARNLGLRIWTSLEDGSLIQMEALIDKLTPPPSFPMETRFLNSQFTMRLAKAEVRRHRDDPFVRDVQWQDFWEKAGRVRAVTVKGKYGKHFINISLETGKVVSTRYDEFPQADGEFSVPVQIFPIYEETDEGHQFLTRISSELRYLNAKVHRMEGDPYAPLKENHYDFENFDPLLGLTAAGRKQGFWAMGYVKAQVSSIIDALPLVDNSFANGGVVLNGRYATVSIYPDAVAKFEHLTFKPSQSYQFLPFIREVAGSPGHEEMVPSGSFLGRPLASAEDAFNRVARRLPDQNPETYFDDGFDEVQVYWAVTRLFESLRPMGFTDPDLSTRPFNAFLYNPDITYRDNAFYTDDTINFTTYSADQHNMARDNPTIWHELGHGVMDRLMGDFIRLADTGGLSEGMADFVASLVLTDLTGGLPFVGKEQMRIINNTGFHLTNEVHDDGEAYGGAMNDILNNAIGHYGRDGLAKVTDLTLEAMRLARNHPALTANDWFDKILFADERGHGSVRAPGELHALILASLNGRNFEFNGKPAELIVLNGSDEVTATGPGSRPRPIPVTLAETESSSYTLKVRVKNGDHFQFKFPITLKAEFLKSPLQGAVHWQGEEKNPLEFTLASETEVVTLPLTISGKCDFVNRPDGSCVDYVHMQIFNQGGQKPIAKKRFYLRVTTKKPAG